MLIDLFNNYFEPVLYIILTLLLSSKMLTLFLAGIPRNKPEWYMRSFHLFSEDEIKNALSERHARFFRMNNKLNKAFISLLLTIILVYVLTLLL